MANINKPGVYVDERPYAAAPVITASGPSTGAFIGVTDRGPTTKVGGLVYGVPALVTSWSDFLSKFSYGSGYNTWTSATVVTSSPLKYSVKSFFDNIAGGQAWVARQVNTDATKANVDVYDRAGEYTTTSSFGGTTYVAKAGAANVISVGFSVDLGLYPRIGSRITLGGTVPSVNINGNALYPLTSLFDATTATAPAAPKRFIVSNVFTGTTALTSVAFSSKVSAASFTLTKTAHGLSVGQLVTVSGFTGASAADYNITSQVAAVTDVNTFTVYSTGVMTADPSGTATVTPVRTVTLVYNNTADSIAPTSATFGLKIKGYISDTNYIQNASTVTLNIAANDEGTWANNIWYTIAPNISDNYFDLTIYYNPTATTTSDVINNGWVEKFTYLSMDSTDAVNYAPTKVVSSYITLTDKGSTATGWYDLPGETGTWGTTASAYTTSAIASNTVGSGYDAGQFTATPVKLTTPTVQSLGTFSAKGTLNASTAQDFSGFVTQNLASGVLSVSSGTIGAASASAVTLITVGNYNATGYRSTITPGVRYGASVTASKAASITAARTFSLFINYYDSSNNFLSNTSASVVSSASSSAGSTLTISPVTPPFNAATYHVTVDYISSATGGSPAAATGLTGTANTTLTVSATTASTLTVNSVAGLAVGQSITASANLTPSPSTITAIDSTTKILTVSGTVSGAITVATAQTAFLLSASSISGDGTTVTATTVANVQPFVVGQVVTISNATIYATTAATITATTATTIQWKSSASGTSTLTTGGSITLNTIGSNEAYTVSALTSTASITSGSDGSNTPTLQTQLDQFSTTTGPLVFNYPGKTSATEISTILTNFGTRADTFVVIDSAIVATGNPSKPYDADTVTNSLSNFASVSSAYVNYGAVYYPSYFTSDPVNSGKVKMIYSGGAVVAKYLSTDLQRGVFKAPAGLGTSLNDAVSVNTISNSDFDKLSNSSIPLNVIRFVPGANNVIMGARTLSTNSVERYVNTRRTLIYLKKQLSDLAQISVFEPNTTNTWTSLSNRLDSFLYDFWRQGGLNGTTAANAYFIKCDADINTSAQVSNGTLLAQVGVALVRPAEFVVISIGQTDGGISVTTTA